MCVGDITTFSLLSRSCSHTHYTLPVKLPQCERLSSLFSFCSVAPSAVHWPLSAHLRHPVVSHHEPGRSSFMAPARSPRELREREEPFLEMSLFWESRSCWEVFWLVHVSRLSAGFSSPWQQLCLRATTAPWLRRSARICWERRTRMELTWSETARPSREPCVFVSSKYTRLPFIKTSFF